MQTRKDLSQVTGDLIRDGFSSDLGTSSMSMGSDPVWLALRDVGTHLWLDTGDVQDADDLWTDEFEALTTNNSLLNKEVQKGLYDEFVGQAADTIRDAAPGMDDQELLLEIAFVLNARHGLSLVERFDAFVSVELHTDLGDDVQRTVEYGRRYHAVCPDRFYVKVPMSPAGLVAARRLAADDIPVNFTLTFSARQDVLSACIAQASFANVFMGRLNAFVKDNDLGDGVNVGEKATLAAQREIRALRQAGRTQARLIGASMRSGDQVGALAGLDVFTMPPKVAREYHEQPLPAVTSQIDADPGVATAEGVTVDDFAGRTLWEVPDVFRACALALAEVDPDQLTPEHVVTELAQAGFGDVFPRWSDADIRTAAEDGKIPVYKRWRDRLETGEIGLDALMTLSAFETFAAAQSELDSRIEKNIS